MPSLLKVSSRDILFIRYSVILLDWCWVDQVFILTLNVPCLCKKHFYRVPHSVCHAVVSVCIQFSLVYIVNNCLPISKSFYRSKYMKLYQFKKEDRQKWNTLRMWFPIYLYMMIYWSYFRNFLHYRDIFLSRCMFFTFPGLGHCLCVFTKAGSSLVYPVAGMWSKGQQKKKGKKKVWKKCVLSKYLYQDIYCWMVFLNSYLLCVN